jgi:hypothetical protein
MEKLEFLYHFLETKYSYGWVSEVQRGYVSFGKEHHKRSQRGDLKEFLALCGQYVDKDSKYAAEYPDNVSKITSFNKWKEAYQCLKNRYIYVLRVACTWA